MLSETLQWAFWILVAASTVFVTGHFVLAIALFALSVYLTAKGLES